jgi:hypothetical protein
MENYVVLSYKTKSPETDIFATNTSWTEGRNMLRQHVVDNQSLHDYDYYCMMDDDLIAKHDGKAREFWVGLENEIYKMECEIATPRCWNYSEMPRGVPPWVSRNHMIDSNKWNYQIADWYDAACNYFTKNIFMDNTILPYETKYDKFNWWSSQLVHIILSNFFYKNRVVQFNNFPIENDQHSEYPQQKKGHSLAFRDLNKKFGDTILLSEVRGFNNVEEYK